MKNFYLVCAATVAVSQSALAADLPRKTAAPVFSPVAAFNWSGFYVGVGAGAAWSDNRWRTTGIAVNPQGLLGIPGTNTNPANFDKTGFQLSAFAGYNYQINQSFVVGLEADIGGSFGGKKAIYGLPGTFPVAYPLGSRDSTTAELGWNGSIRGRLGFAVMPTVLIYGAGGVAFQHAKYSATCNAGFPGWCIANRTQSESSTRAGWTLGAGVEAQIWGNILGRVEYRYADFGSKGTTYFPGTFDAMGVRTTLRTHTLQAGLAYKF